MVSDKRDGQSAKANAMKKIKGDAKETDQENIVDSPVIEQNIIDKTQSIKKSAKEDRAVVYVGRIPHGFYEEQMRSYFSQFGVVTRLRLSRNKKTGKSKHYAFIEFKHKEVADVVVETMDGYLMLGQILQCKIESIL